MALGVVNAVVPIVSRLVLGAWARSRFGSTPSGERQEVVACMRMAGMQKTRRVWLPKSGSLRLEIFRCPLPKTHTQKGKKTSSLSHTFHQQTLPHHESGGLL